MPVDAHVNIDSGRYPIERAVQVLEGSRIDGAIVFADPRASDPDIQNDYVLKVANERGLYPFFYIGGNPWTDTRPDGLPLADDLDRYAGIRWHRWVGEGVDREGILEDAELTFAVSLMESSEFESVVSAAAYHSMPVIFEESFSVTLEFVLRYPSLDVIIPHLGAHNGGQLNVLRALWDTPNVYFDTSLMQLDEVTLARVGSERILFASGYPYGDPETELNKIDQLPITDEAKEGIYGENLESLLSAYRERTRAF